MRRPPKLTKEEKAQQRAEAKRRELEANELPRIRGDIEGGLYHNGLIGMLANGVHLVQFASHSVQVIPEGATYQPPEPVFEDASRAFRYGLEQGEPVRVQIQYAGAAGHFSLLVAQERACLIANTLPNGGYENKDSMVMQPIYKGLQTRALLTNFEITNLSSEEMGTLERIHITTKDSPDEFDRRLIDFIHNARTSRELAPITTDDIQQFKREHPYDPPEPIRTARDQADATNCGPLTVDNNMLADTYIRRQQDAGQPIDLQHLKNLLDEKMGHGAGPSELRKITDEHKDKLRQVHEVAAIRYIEFDSKYVAMAREDRNKETMAREWAEIYNEERERVFGHAAAETAVVIPRGPASEMPKSTHSAGIKTNTDAKQPMDPAAWQAAKEFLLSKDSGLGLVQAKDKSNVLVNNTENPTVHVTQREAKITNASDRTQIDIALKALAAQQLLEKGIPQQDIARIVNTSSEWAKHDLKFSAILDNPNSERADAMMLAMNQRLSVLSGGACNLEGQPKLKRGESEQEQVKARIKEAADTADKGKGEQPDISLEAVTPPAKRS